MKLLNKKSIYRIIILLTFIVLYLYLEANYITVMVKGESMLPTLNENDRLIIKKVDAQEIHRSEIVVFKDRKTNKLYIKRVVGVPGDHLFIKSNELYVNDNKVLEFDNNSNPFPVKDLKEFILQRDDFFVIGDNVDNSRDSREMGPISYTQIKGVGILVYWPFINIKSFSFSFIANIEI